MSNVQCPVSNIQCPISNIQYPMSYIQRLISISILISQFLLLSCSKEKSIAEVVYNNPPKDSIKFAYRLNTLYYFDRNSKETTFDFTLDTGLYYAWKSVDIKYEDNANSIQLTPEYTNGYITSWIDNSFNQLLSIEYNRIPPSNLRLITSIKYFRANNPFALVFKYDSINLSKVEFCNLDLLSREIGGIIEEVNFCSNENIGSCTSGNPSGSYVYSFIMNSLYRSNELAPFLFILKNPNLTGLNDILPELPLYFSRHYPDGILKPIQNSYEYGLNAKKEPSFFYYRPLPGNLVLGYNFSMR